MRNANLNFAVSDALKNKITSIGVPSDKTQVITNGVDTNLFMPLSTEVCRSKLGLGLPNNAKIVLYIGNLQKEKGVIYLLNAFNNLAQQNLLKDIRLIIVGNGPLKEEFVSYVIKWDLQDSITFIEAQHHHMIPIWINSCDVLCLPSISEGCPNVILEALACGTPVVASKVGGVPELIFSEKLGVLFEKSNVDELVEGLLVALKKKWDINFIVNSVKYRSWDTKAKEMVQVYKKVLSKNKSVVSS